MEPEMKTVVGILIENGRDGLVRADYPDAEGKRRDVWIPWRYLNGAPFGMRVVCQVDHPEAEQWRGAILEVLGDPSRPDVAIAGILAHYRLKPSFPEAVEKEAAALPAALEPAETARLIRSGRKDRRALPTITIDGEDAKDLDDAISIERLANRGFRLWVHIADVAHYVTDNSSLDVEARRRGTSVYLVDRVVPMLPPRLSNGICSINPQADRLALTVEMEIDRDGMVTGGDIYESVIRSDARTSYKQIHDFLEKGEGREQLGEIDSALMAMRELAEILHTRLRQRGMLEFEFPETRVDLDESGRPIAIYPYPLTYTNGIIEAFMIAANEFVAERFFLRKSPFVYRVHEQPDPEKLRRFARLANNMGVRLRFRGVPRSADLAAALVEIREMEYGQALSQLLLRSLAKARYAPESLGHYGLASTYYCHFTAPIRRYPDLFIHRIIKGWLSGHVDKKKWQQEAIAVSETGSQSERLAEQAARDSVQQKACEYMAGRLGEVFDGVVSGIIQAGFFVRLPNTIEGMVPFRSMEDYFEYDEESLTARGTRSGRTIRIGENVRVRVARVDTIQRKIDFALEGEEKQKNSRPARKAPAHKSRDRKNQITKTKTGRKAGAVKRSKQKKKRV